MHAADALLVIGLFSECGARTSKERCAEVERF